MQGAPRVMREVPGGSELEIEWSESISETNRRVCRSQDTQIRPAAWLGSSFQRVPGHPCIHVLSVPRPLLPPGAPRGHPYGSRRGHVNASEGGMNSPAGTDDLGVVWTLPTHSLPEPRGTCSPCFVEAEPVYPLEYSCFTLHESVDAGNTQHTPEAGVVNSENKYLGNSSMPVGPPSQFGTAAFLANRRAD